MPIPAYVRMDSKEGNTQANGQGLGLGIVGNKASKNVKDQNSTATTPISYQMPPTRVEAGPKI